MSLETTIYGTLTGSSSVVDLVGERIIPSAAKQGTESPYVVWRRISTIPTVLIEGASDHERTNLQFLCFAVDFDTARSIASAVKAVLDGQTLAEGEVVDVAGWSDYFDERSQLYCSQLDFRVLHTITP